MLLKDFIQQSKTELGRIYTEKEAGVLVNAVCKEFFGTESYSHIVNPSLEVPANAVASAQSALDRLAKEEPIQYVLGYTEFYSHRFKVNSSVLIPRPETEELCRLAIKYAMMLYRKRTAFGDDATAVRVLDLCTGSGCIAWTLASGIPFCNVMGVDISEDAVKTARSQFFELGKEQFVRFVKADILDDDSVKAAMGKEKPFDFILSNPPYVMDKEKALMKRNVLDYEPAIALFVPDDDPLLFYRKIAELSESYLNTPGIGLVEINEALGAETAAIFRSHGFKNVEIIKDLSGRNRMVKYEK